MTVGCDSEKVAIEREQRHACMGYAERERVRRSQMQVQNEVTEHGIEACNMVSLGSFSLPKQREERKDSYL